MDDTDAGEENAEARPTTDEDERRSDINELLSPRSEIFRSKLMNEFHLLESLGAGGALDSADEPHLHTPDALDDGLCRAMMMKEPNSLIQFQVYSDKVSGCAHIARFLAATDRIFLYVSNLT